MKKRILVVDDAKTWREALTFSLAAEDREIIVAATLEEAKNQLREQSFDVALVDLALKGEQENDFSETDGQKLLETIRQDYPQEPMSTVVITAWGTAERARDAFKEYDVFDFVAKNSKPGSGEQLARVVEDALSKGRTLTGCTWEDLIERTFGGPVSERIVQQVLGIQEPDSIELRKLTYHLQTFVIPREILPFSVDVVGPTLVQSEPRTSTLICWSRAECRAVQVEFQEEVAGAGRPRFPEPNPEWEAEPIKGPRSNSKLWGQSFWLKHLKFDDFCKMVAGC